MKAKPFYDATMAALGAVCMYEDSKAGVLGYGPGYDTNLEPLNIFERSNSSPAGAGFHLAFNAPNRQSMRAFWEAALQHGGADDGKWSLREECGTFYYAAFVRDPDGNRLEAVFQEADEECATSAEDLEKIKLTKNIVQQWVCSTPTRLDVNPNTREAQSDGRRLKYTDV